MPMHFPCCSHAKLQALLAGALPFVGSQLGAPGALTKPSSWHADGQSEHAWPSWAQLGKPMAGATRAEWEARGDPKTEPDISSPPGISATIPGEYTQIKRRNLCMDGSFQGKLCNPLVCRFLQIRRPTHSENHGSQKVLAWVNRGHLAQSSTKTHD